MAACTLSDNYTTYTGNAQGTTYRIVANPGSEAIERGIEATFEEIDQTFSMFNPVSLVSRINRGETDQTTPLFDSCFEIARGVWSHSGGYYDITVKPLVDAWGFGPGAEQATPCVECIKEYVGMDKVRIEGGIMIKTLLAWTALDDPEEAVEDILSQLAMERNLRARSAGLLFCYYDFIKTGVVRELCARLPFPVAGCTSQGFAVNPGGGGETVQRPGILALLVLTSDDLTFTPMASAPLTDNAQTKSAMREAYQKAAAGIEQPAVIFGFAPVTDKVLTEVMLNSLSEASGNAPIFGSIALDFDTEYRNQRTILNGADYADCFTALAVSGPLHPGFHTAIIERSVTHGEAVITKAKRNCILELNNMPALDYFKTIGLDFSKVVIGTQISCLLWIEYPKGTETMSFIPLVVGTDPESGGIVCTRRIMVGDTVRVGNFLESAVCAQTRGLCRDMKAGTNRNAALFFQCLGRGTILSDLFMEMNIINEEIKDTPYLAVLSGGELATEIGADGKPFNHYLSFALTGCAL
jgi:hypothetical protein